MKLRPWSQFIYEVFLKRMRPWSQYVCHAQIICQAMQPKTATMVAFHVKGIFRRMRPWSHIICQAQNEL